MEYKRILVTGGAGFVDSNLCERLLKQGHYVICMDNFIRDKKPISQNLKIIQTLNLLHMILLNHLM